MRILTSVNLHIRKPKCAYTKALFCICAFWLSSMGIYRRKKCAYTEAKMHIYEREPFVYVHFGFCICTFTEAKMRIYGRELPYMRITASVDAHIWKTKSAYTEESFRICAFTEGKNEHFGFRKCAFTEAKMCIYGSQNAHIRKRASVYGHFGFRKSHGHRSVAPWLVLQLKVD
jgi:hypothetical protein